jgi:hypothetical protein
VSVTHQIVGALMSTLLASSAGTTRHYLSLSEEEGRRTWTEFERASVNHASITWWGSSAPFKCFLLIQDGDALCAIRFTNFVRGQDARPPSIWTSGDETLTSVYEWHVLARTDGKVTSKRHGQAIAQFTAPRGFGHLIVAGGYDNVQCGDKQYNWIYPDAVHFPSGPNSPMRMAPTKWTEVSQIQVDDPSLKWFAADKSRADVRIPRERL